MKRYTFITIYIIAHIVGIVMIILGIFGITCTLFDLHPNAWASWIFFGYISISIGYYLIYIVRKQHKLL